MKPELNNELKARFFGLYLGHQIEAPGTSYKGGSLFKISARPGSPMPYVAYQASDETLHDNDIKNCCLLLRTFSAITEEDARALADIQYRDKPEFRTRYLHHKSDYGQCVLDSFLDRAKNGYIINTAQTIEIYQYLQSRGYALPFMGYSMDELVQAGWVKLIE